MWSLTYLGKGPYTSSCYHYSCSRASHVCIVTLCDRLPTIYTILILQCIHMSLILPPTSLMQKLPMPQTQPSHFYTKPLLINVRVHMYYQLKLLWLALLYWNHIAVSSHTGYEACLLLVRLKVLKQISTSHYVISLLAIGYFTILHCEIMPSGHIISNVRSHVAFLVRG